MDLGLEKKVALITGSSKGLGLATAQILLNEGARVMINSRHQENINSALDKLAADKNRLQAKGVAGDVTNENTCREIVEKTAEEFGGFDILITNSGGPPPGTFSNLSTDQWRKAIDLSFLSHVYLIKYSIPYLIKSHNPSVLAVTSFTIKSPLENLILSNTVRAATAALIKSLSIELGGHGIRFNSILPGWTQTGRVENLLQNRAQEKKTSVKEEADQISKNIPLGRMGSPQEFSKAAAFLSITGRIIYQWDYAECGWWYN